MRGNGMGYFWGLVKKEYIEIRYSYKSLMWGGIAFALFFYMAQTLIDQFDVESCYLVTFLITVAAPLEFIMNSFLSDKRNQTFERCFVSGNIKVVMLAKYASLGVLGIIPFAVFFIVFLANGITIFESVYVAINTPFYFWIILCLGTLTFFIFSDEKSASFGAIPCILLTAGIIKLNQFISSKYNPAFTCIITIVCALVATFAAHKVYKNTKYFLKI